MPGATTDWDGEAYDRLAAPQEAWARRVLERLPLEGSETVLDAGCGSGRATKLLLEMLPHGKVVGVDGSPSMLEVARKAFSGDSRVSLLGSDLLELTPAAIEGVGVDRVDAVFSNATFHWIADHDLLFQRLFAVLAPGARLVAQCGGRGNVEAWVTAVRAASGKPPYAEHVDGYHPWNFYGPDETEARLAAAGFVDVHCWLEEMDVVVPEDPHGFVAVCGLAGHSERLPADLRESFIDAVVAEFTEPVELRYVRLNIDASRPAEGGS